MKKILLLIFIMFIAALPSFSQEEEPVKIPRDENMEPDQKLIFGDFWIGPSIEAAMYNSGTFNIGGGISFGYGKGASIGLKTVYLFDNENNTNILELMFLLRFYFFGRDYCSGLFIQIMGGQSLFFRQDEMSIPTRWGIFNAGINLGWRFHIGKLFYIEPIIRAGYPYFLGFAVSCGVHF